MPVEKSKDTKYPHPFLANVDDAISSAVPRTIDLEHQIGVPKTYVAGGIASVLFLLIFFNYGAAFFVNIIGVVFPALAAFSALDSPATEANKEDLAHWLTYFVIFAALTTIEYFQNVLLYWLPFYYLLKAIGLIYLMLPATKGALTVFRTTIQPHLGKLSAKPSQPKAQ